jgi:hypothetical protein
MPEGRGRDLAEENFKLWRFRSGVAECEAFVWASGRGSVSDNATNQELTPFLCLGFMQLNLFGEIHPHQQVLEARVGAQIVDPQVGPQKVRKVGGSLLIRFFQEFEGFAFIS